MQKSAPLGIFDSGIGGLTVVRAVQQLLPSESIVYLGDTARVPYGGKSPSTVTRYSQQICQFLLQHEVKAIVVACNTASAHALPLLQQEFPVPAIGVVKPGVEAALKATLCGRIGVLATPGTIASQAYQQALLTARPDLQIHAYATPLLVPLIEEDWLDHAATRMVLEEYLAPLKAARIDTLVLGCTHYPLLRPLIADLMGPEVTLVDSASTCAEHLKRLLMENQLLAPEEESEPGQTEVHLTDLPLTFEATSRRFLEREHTTATVVAIPS